MHVVCGMRCDVSKGADTHLPPNNEHTVEQSVPGGGQAFEEHPRAQKKKQSKVSRKELVSRL